MGDAREEKDSTTTTTTTNSTSIDESSITTTCKFIENGTSSSSSSTPRFSPSPTVAEYHHPNGPPHGRYNPEMTRKSSSCEGDVAEEHLLNGVKLPHDEKQEQHINGDVDGMHIDDDNDDEEEEEEKERFHKIKFRSLNPSDRITIQKLHEEWFPVQYEDKFYDCLVEHKMMGSNERLYSCVATFEVEEDYDYEDEKDVESGVSIEILDDEENEVEEEGRRGGRRREEIAGCIVGTFVTPSKPTSSSRPTNNNTSSSNSNLNEEISTILLPNPYKHTKMFYIMTLGTVHKYRNRGIGSTLVEQMIQKVVEREERCGVVYLHVITYNERAIGFYERLGFVRVKEIEDYYRINGENYNCYLYAKYFHGNRGHWTIMSYLSSIVSSVWKRFTDVIAPPAISSSSAATSKNSNSHKVYI